MRVKVTRQHENELGDKRLKKVGDEYDAGDHAAVLIAGGLAVPVKSAKAPLDFARDERGDAESAKAQPGE